MDVITYLVDELDREAARSRKALEQVPDDSRSFKPHDRSMEFGPLTDMVAMIPMWLTMVITQDQQDIAPKDGKGMEMPKPKTSAEYLEVFDKALADARAAISGTTVDHLQMRWKLLAGGKVVADTTRLEMLSDTLNHWVHHRGQMTVYLRLMGAKVPALYGPSADENSFA